MKKFLLTLSLVMTAVFGALAQTTVEASKLKADGSVTESGYTFAIAKNNGSTAPAFHSGTSAMRLYAKGSLTISGEKITKIVVTLAKDAGYRYTTFTPSTGALNPKQAVGDSEITWTGDATSVTFTVGDKASLGTDGEAKAGQIRFTSITIYGEGGSAPDTPDTPDTPSVDTEGAGTELDPYTVADVIKLGNPGPTGVWVSGYIVGVMNYIDGQGNVFTSTDLTSNSNVVIAASATETNTANMVCIQLPASIRGDINLADRPGNLGKELLACGDIMKYCGIPGVKNTSKATIVGGPAAIVPAGDVESLTAFIEEQNTTSFLSITNPVTVFYQSPDKQYTFITDGESNIEVYGAMTNTYANGDQLSGIVGKYNIYNNMPQITPDVASFGAATKGAEIEPVKVSNYASVKPNDYVLIENATITASTQGGNEGGNEGGGNQGGNQGGNVPAGGTTINADKLKADGSMTEGGYTIAIAKNSSSTAPTFHEGTGAMRIYAKGSLTISGKKITKVIFTLAKDNSYRYTTFNPSTGALNPAQAEGDTQITWVGDATSVTFTVGDKATLGSESEKNGQIRITSITVYGEDGTPASVISRAETKATYTISDGTTTLTVFDRFNIGVAAGNGLNILGIGAVYGETNQIFPIAIYDPASISEINTAASEKSAIYDLQGRKLAAPVKGINIINGKKVLVK